MSSHLNKCRLCLKKTDSSPIRNLFRKDNGTSYAMKILEMLSIELIDTANWPRFACITCVSILDKLPRFQRFILINHEKLYTEIHIKGASLTSVQGKCRLCLKNIFSDNPTDLFRSNQERSHADRIFDLMSVVLEENPRWPTKGCPDCVSFLYQLIKLEADIVSSHKELYSITPKTRTRTLIGFPMKALPFMKSLTSPAPKPKKDILIEIDSEEGNVVQEEENVQYEEFPDVIPPTVEAIDSISSLPETATETPTTEDTKETSTEMASFASTSLVREWSVPTEEEWELEKLMVELKIFVCKICELDSGSFLKLREHVRTVHDTSVYHICCSTEIEITPVALYDHFRLHVNKEAFKCKLCGTKLIKSEELRRHMEKNHSAKVSYIFKKSAEVDEMEIEAEGSPATSQVPSKYVKPEVDFGRTSSR